MGSCMLQDMKEVQRGGADKRERSLTARGGAAGVEVQPNNAAPLLRDEHARRQWVEQELDACCQARAPCKPSLNT